MYIGHDKTEFDLHSRVRILESDGTVTRGYQAKLPIRGRIVHLLNGLDDQCAETRANYNGQVFFLVSDCSQHIVVVAGTPVLPKSEPQVDGISVCNGENCRRCVQLTIRCEQGITADPVPVRQSPNLPLRPTSFSVT